MSYKYDIGTEPGQVAESPTFGVRFQALEHVWTLYFFLIWLVHKRNFRTILINFIGGSAFFTSGEFLNFWGLKNQKIWEKVLLAARV